jgi:Flp pilus assembly protein TadD
MRKRVWRLHEGMLMRGLVLLLLGTVYAGAAWCVAKPLSRRQVEGLVRGAVASQRIAHLVSTRGVDFTPTSGFLRLLKTEGAQPVLLERLEQAGHRLPREARQRRAAPAAPLLSPQAVHYALEYAEAQRDFEQGTQAFRNQQWPDVEKEMKRATQLDPMNIEAHFDLGYALSQQQKLPQAINEYRRVLQLDPDSGAVHYDLGVALEKEHDLNAAIPEFRQAARLDPSDERAAYALGAALYDQNDWPGAAAELRNAVRLAPTDANAHCALGLAELHQHRVDDAIPELSEALRLNPQNALAHAALAGALLRKGDRRAALKEFQVAVALNPANSAYRNDLQNLWRQLHLPPAHSAVNP